MSTAQARRFAIVALSALVGLLPAGVGAQTKVRSAEVARSLLFAPFYVAVSRGYFKDAGLEVSITTIPGGKVPRFSAGSALKSKVKGG